MRIAIVGTGYVGLVTGACLADLGYSVTCVDVDESKIESIRAGRLPFYEPGLEEVVGRNVRSGRLKFNTTLKPALADADVVFIAVGTPPGEDGSADLSMVLAVASDIGAEIAALPDDRYLVVVTKSTVPVGTSVHVRSALLAAGATNGRFDVASNPEFLKEGAAVEDFFHPDRIVIGVDNDRSRAVLEKVYRPLLLNGRSVLFMDIASAEITKYAANAMLAMRISFMNLVAGLCEHEGADIKSVRAGVGSDSRIGMAFLYAGAGYGGSCFPKDVRALGASLRERNLDAGLLTAVEGINQAQRRLTFRKVCTALGVSQNPSSLVGHTVSVWGLSFKPNTDDVRESPSVALVAQLLELGCTVRVYDPIAALPSELSGASLVGDAMQCCEGSDVLVLMTEWSEFRAPDYAHLARVIRRRSIVDARNVLSVEDAKSFGFSVLGVGRNA